MNTAAETETETPRFRLVDPHALDLEHPHWHNPRTITGMSKDDLRELADDIKARGLRDRPKVLRVKNGNGEIHDLVLDGQRRTLASRLAHLKEIEVEDYSAEPIDLTQEAAIKIMLHVLKDVSTRSGLGSYEQSSVAVQLRDQGVSVVRIAAAIGRDASWVSRFLAARASASEKVLEDWRSGTITDEQFKDLAALKPKKQEEMLEKTAELRSQGGKGKAEARAVLKEAKADQQRRTEIKKLAQKVTWDPKAKKEVKGESKPKAQPALDPKILTSPPRPAAKPAMTSRVMLEEIIAMAGKKPPLHDYVKGVMAGVAHALGLVDPSKFAAPWHTYLSRLPGKRSTGGKGPSRAKTKAKKPAKAASPHKGSTAKPSTKAKPKKKTKAASKRKR